MPYFHMGADEAFTFGVCAGDLARMNRTMPNAREHLALNHMSIIAKHIISRSNGNTKLVFVRLTNTIDYF
jgi:hypothetical protein